MNLKTTIGMAAKRRKSHKIKSSSPADKVQSILNRIHAVGQASRLSLTLNFRLGMRILHTSPHPLKRESIFLIWRQARRLSYAASRSEGNNLTTWIRLKIITLFSFYALFVHFCGQQFAKIRMNGIINKMNFSLQPSAFSLFP
jgi:hypothetical protein